MTDAVCCDVAKRGDTKFHDENCPLVQERYAPARYPAPNDAFVAITRGIIGVVTCNEGRPGSPRSVVAVGAGLFQAFVARFAGKKRLSKSCLPVNWRWEMRPYEQRIEGSKLILTVDLGDNPAYYEEGGSPAKASSWQIAASGLQVEHVK